MTAETIQPLHEIPGGTRAYVDATVFLYHFTGASPDCRAFLARCEAAEIHGLASVVTLAEVTHRLMMIEAVTRGLVSPGNVAKKLREQPAIVRQLGIYQEQVERIPLMGIEVVPLYLPVLATAARLRAAHGLLTNDSLVLATAQEHGVAAIASADRDFAAVESIQLFAPDDLS